jgi:hypothetical protein
MSGETKQRIGDLEAEIARLKAAQPTLRDQFAMAALTGTITRSATYFGVEDFSSFAAWSYEIADAMMEARNAKD